VADLSHKGREAVYEHVDGIPQLNERPQDLATTCWTRLGERYMEREVHIEAYFHALRPGPGEWPSRYYLAIFERAVDEFDRLDRDFPVFLGDLDAALASGTTYDHKGLVLVGVSESSENPERMAFKSVPSVIRLFVLDDRLSMGRQSSNPVVAAGSSPCSAEIAHRLGDGEAGIAGRAASAVARSDQPDDVVEGAVEMVGDLADEQSPAGSGDLPMRTRQTYCPSWSSRSVPMS
jgi:hypothetical protein